MPNTALGPEGDLDTPTVDPTNQIHSSMETQAVKDEWADTQISHR